MSYKPNNPTEAIVENRLNRVWLQLYRFVLPLTLSWKGLDRYQFEFTFTAQKSAPAPSDPLYAFSPSPPLKAVRAQDSYLFEVIGPRLAVHCREFAVIISPGENLVEILGESVSVEVRYKVGKERKVRGFISSRCRIGYDRPPPEEPLICYRFGSNRGFEGYNFYCGGILVVISREKRLVRIYGGAVKAFYRDRPILLGEGYIEPEPFSQLREVKLDLPKHRNLVHPPNPRTIQ